jgi:hypothetical protein
LALLKRSEIPLSSSTPGWRSTQMGWQAHPVRLAEVG